jgi:hypothetical protein
MSKTQNDDQARKDAAYPYYDLESSIELAGHIKELGGSKGAVKKSILARKVGLAESTPSFFQKLSAAKTFGIIDGRGEYSLTELGKTYFYPQADGAAATALLSMFAYPPAFQAVINRFDGETLPKTEMLGNIFHQELGVPISWKDRVAQLFARSALYAGIIDANGFLRYDAATQTKPVERNEMLEAPVRLPGLVVPPAAKTVTTPAGYYSSPQTKVKWVNDQITVETPLKISPELWEQLNAYVQILKPLANKKEMDRPPFSESGLILNEENLILHWLNGFNGLGKTESQIAEDTKLPVFKVAEVLGRRPEMFVRGTDLLWRKKG